MRIIYKETSLTINDYFDFFDAIDFVETYKYNEFIKKTQTEETYRLHQQVIKKQPTHSDSFSKLFDLVESAIYNLRISKKELEFFMPIEKLDKLCNIFSVKREDNNDYLFYTQDCPLMNYPIIELPDGTMMIPMQKQLIHSIYAYLFQVCTKLDHSGQRILERRDKQLEEKTRKIFASFFEKDAKIFSNYYVEKNEKDLLILYRNTAFIIECKAHKYREPLLNTEKAFTRIKDDFRKNIQKGYNQTYEVKQLFQQNKVFQIRNSKNEIIENINPQKYQNVFSIVVTQERFGQIQTDLGLLLNLEKDDNLYPWSVYIDDLETFLITLKRKENYYGDFITYLYNRERLHKRVICSDELELAALFFTQKNIFIDYCNRNEYFLSSPTENRLFDDLYYIGFGFENERGLDRKIERWKILSKELSPLFKKCGFKKTPSVIREYKKNTDISF
jgi:hypothetical protein